ncbi:MAG: hypothetical protein KI790_17720 [Cyclobacteriaceae bacterium]|nr:hypothetical protein [Cyclobacteriaceae bacterium HetDA_MAG_MS6]
MKYAIFSAFVFVSLSMQAQKASKALSIEKLHLKGFSAQFSPEGDRLLYAGKHFNALFLYDLDQKEVTKVADGIGVGFEPIITSDAIIYQKCKDELERIELASEERQIVPVSQNNLNPKDYLARDQKLGEVYFARSSSDLRSIVLLSYAGAKEITPLGDVDYINISLSPDRKKVLFRVSGMGSYIADLNGKVLGELGDVEFPKWVNDDEVLYTETEDDGYQYIRSNVYIESLAGGSKIALTVDSDAIALYPSVSQDESKVVFNTPEGELYLIHR